MPDHSLDTGELELRDYLSVLRRRKLTIILTTLAAVGLALGISYLITPTYRATAEILVEDDPVGTGGAPVARSAADRLADVQTEVRVMRSRSVRLAVAQELGYDPDIDIEVIDDTSVVAVNADSTDPDRATTDANTYAETFIELRRASRLQDIEASQEVVQAQIDQIDEQLADFDSYLAGLDAQIANAPDDEARRLLEEERNVALEDFASRRTTLQSQRADFAEELGNLQVAETTSGAQSSRIVTDAITPTRPASPDPVRNAGFAVVAGLILGAALAFLRDYLDDTIRNKDDLDLVTGGIDVLGLVPRVETWKNRAIPQVVTITQPSSPPAEAYRGLRTSLQFIGIGRHVRIVQLTSSAAAEGKTTTLANLGVALARAGNRVVLVDFDLRRPRLHQFFGLDNAKGLTTALLGDHHVVDALQSVPDVPRLAMLASGPPPPNPSELLSTSIARETLEALAEQADYVLVDCPPLLPVADAVIVAGYVDATVVVATVDSTTKRSLARALELLRQVDAPLVGVVLNGLQSEAAYAYSYDGGYAYAYAQSKDDSPSLAARLLRRRPTGPRVSREDASNAPLPASDDVADHG